jgi:hypothetical protein
MPPAKYLAYAAELLKVIPPHITDQPMIAELKKIGFEPGKSFDLDKADPIVQQGLATAAGEAQQLMTWKMPTMARVANGWSTPANAFWSVTLYDSEGFQVANPLNCFNLSSWMPLKYNADGSIDLYFQIESPGSDKEANWLPAPRHV